MSFSTRSSSSSTNGGMSSRLRTLALGTKPHVAITLDNEQATYTTLDRIAGKVEITAAVSTRFEDVDIQFIGMSKTFVERLHATPSMSRGTSAFHQFLKLTQPIPESAYPQPRILEAGRTYEFPFLFVVPQQLLPRVCRHAVEHESVRDAHLQLPPSMGSGSSMDDFCPDMANVRYSVAARILTISEVTGEKQDLVHRAKVLQIIPASAEQPPVNVDGAAIDYTMRSEKSVKKGVFKGKLGSLVIEATQPKSLRLQRDELIGSASTLATIRLRFDPAEAKNPPPRLGSLSSKIKVSTWFASKSRTLIPTKKCIMHDYNQGLHTEMKSLSSRCISAVEWKFHKNEEALALSRRDSANSTSSSYDIAYPAPSEKYQGQGFYTAEIIVPVTLPSDKHFTPTFHSCLISRAYTLYFSLGIHTSGVGGPSIELKVPVQVSAEGSGAEAEQNVVVLTAEELQEEALSADDLFVTRTMSRADDGLVVLPGINDLPPDYESFARPTLGVRVNG